MLDVIERLVPPTAGPVEPAERLIQLLGLSPAARSTGEFALFESHPAPDGSFRWIAGADHQYAGRPPQRWGPYAHARPAARSHPERGCPAARTIADVPIPSAVRHPGAQDRCPGAVRLHQAADGGLARVRIPGGMLTAVQWQVLVAAARELG